VIKPCQAGSLGISFDADGKQLQPADEPLRSDGIDPPPRQKPGCNKVSVFLKLSEFY
jgi:hypothetical protein